LYSQRDIEIIKWLMKRQAEGLSISRAVDLWNEQVASGTDPLAGASQFAAGAAVPVRYEPRDTTLDSLRAQWVQACLEFSESATEQALNQAFSLFPIEAVCIEVLQKGMSEIGDLWYENRSSVQQEHFASGLAIRRLDALLSASPAPTRNQTVIVGCPPGEWHTFTPLLLALLLRRRGLNVLYLGANVPDVQFAETVKNTGANLVVLAAQHLISAATLKHTALVLSSQKIPVAFGGRIFNLRPEMSRSISATFLGNDLPGALEGIEVILSGKARDHMPRGNSEAYAAAHQAFLSRRAQIELTLRKSMEPLSIAPDDIDTGIHFLGENILAALQLGDIAYVSAEIDWLQGLLQSHGSPEDQVGQFLQAYSRAVDQNINGQGQIIHQWLTSEVERLRTD
jgi:methanogenic corrinoid protein MtbC1